MIAHEPVKVGWQTTKLTLIAGEVTSKEVRTDNLISGTVNNIDNLKIQTDTYQVREADGSVRVIDVRDANLGIAPGNQAAFVVAEVYSKRWIFTKGPFQAPVAARNQTTKQTFILDPSIESLTGFTRDMKRFALFLMACGIVGFWITFSSRSVSAQGLAWSAALFLLGLRLRFGKRRERLKVVRQAVVELMGKIS